MAQKTIFPGIKVLLNYDLRNLRYDASSGLTVGVMLIPQGIAYAMIAGLPPVYGLYAALVPQLVYALLGTSRLLAVGPVAMDSLLVAAGLSLIAVQGTETYISYAILLALMVGVFQFVLGLFRMGFITNLLAKPVITGFTTAAAIIIALGQLKHLLGYEVRNSSNIGLLVLDVLKGLDQIHWLTFSIGICGFLIILILKKSFPKLPNSLFVVIAGMAVVSVFNLEGLGVEIVGSIPKGLPSFSFPALQWSVVEKLFPLALTIAIIAYMEAFSISKALEAKKRDHQVHANKELLALGVGNILGSLFQAFPTTAGFSRSAVNFESGGRTQVTSLISAVVIALVLLFLTPLFYFLPKAILAAVIMTAVVGLVDFKYAYSLWLTNKMEFAILLATLIITVSFGMVMGIFGGILLSIILLLYRLGYPHIAFLGRVPEHQEFRNVRRFNDLEVWEDLLILRVDSPLTFVNIQYFRDRLEKKLINQGDKIKAILLDAGPISQIDATAISGLEDLLNSFRKRGIQFMIADVVGPVRDQLHRSGLVAEIGKTNFFLNLNDAVDYYFGNVEHKFLKFSSQSEEV